MSGVMYLESEKHIKILPKGIFRIQNQLLFCLSAAMLAPSSIKIVNITFFDVCIYMVLLKYVIDWSLYPFSSRRINAVEMGLVALLFVVLLGYLINYPNFNEQKTFIESIGLNTDFLYFRLSLYGVMTLIMLLGVFRIVSKHMTMERDFKKVVNIIIVTGTINAIITIAAWLIQTGGVFDRYNYIPPIEESQGIHLDRMALTFLMAFATWSTGNITKVKRLGVMIAMATSGFSIITVMVRQGWFMFAVILIIFIGLFWKHLSIRRRLGAVVTFIIIVSGGLYFAVIQYQGMVQDSFSGISASGEDVLIRSLLVEQGIKVFQASPLFGVGYGHYVAYSTESVVISGEEEYVASAHNGIIMVAAETGIFGMACYIWICGNLLKTIIGARNSSISQYNRAVATAILSLLLVSLITQTISNSPILPLPAERLVTQNSFILWFLFGLASCIHGSKGLSSIDNNRYAEKIL